MKPQDYINRCHFGDCRDVLRQMIADGVRVNCLITSPPYWGTTAKVAQSLGRNWLGIELNPAYGQLQDGRITQHGFAFS